jgi:hypothetical protein
VAESFEQGLVELESIPETVENQTRGLSPERWEERVFEGENGWNRRQLLAHIATINLRHLVRVRAAVGQGDVADARSLPPIDEWNTEQVGARGARGVDDLLAELRANRRDLVALLRSLTPQQREQFRFPRGDRSLTMAEWIPFVLEHDRTHLAEIVG